MSEYKIPEEFYFQLHHSRPRFKNDVENVLIFYAENVTAVGKRPKKEFVKLFDERLFQYPGNANKKLKTIDNWRTEIDSLFGFVEVDGKSQGPSRRAKELAESQDLVQFFKTYLFNFQYPGGHIKPERALEQIKKGVHFKPAQFILKLLRHAGEVDGNGHRVGITKSEVCHCIFNDLRCTRDNEDVSLTWQRIKSNRNNEITYDQTGDVIRYAGDIIDSMEWANLLVTYDGKLFYLNKFETDTISVFIESTEWFSGYDQMIAARDGSTREVGNKEESWIQYVNRDLADTDFSTNILAYMADDEDQLAALQRGIAAAAEQDQEAIAAMAEEKAKGEAIIEERISTELDTFSTKDIGDIGEALVHGHECMRVMQGGRRDMLHLIKKIPTPLAVGYDIQSVELDELKRYIEVKTTVSAKKLRFNKVHLTKNEWNTARSTKERYFVYRLMINKEEKRLFLLQNPVGLYEQGDIQIVIDEGVDITFDPNRVGESKELLTWRA